MLDTLKWDTGMRLGGCMQSLLLRRGFRLLAILFSSFGLLLSFQNCSGGFKTLSEKSGSFDLDSGLAAVCVSGEKQVGYLMGSVLYPLTCGQPVTKTCVNGQWDRSDLLMATCKQQCVHPDTKQAVDAGTSYISFSIANGATQVACDAAKVTSLCDQATGTFLPAPAPNKSCLVVGQVCAYTNGNGIAVPSGNLMGATVTGYKSATAVYPSLCGAQSVSTCQANGTWNNGAPLYSACAQKCIHPDTKQPVNAATSYSYYTLATGTKANCDAAKVTSTCTATTGLFVPLPPAVRYSACAVITAPVISSLTANPTSIAAGASSTISWNQTGATALTLTPGNINVTGKTSQVVSPPVDTIYTLTASNQAGSVAKTVSIAVTAVVEVPSVPGTVPAFCSGTQYFISPSGNNSAAGTTAATAVKSFAKAFSKMTAGDQLILLDGTYSVSAGTGIINWADNASMGNSGLSEQIPSGVSVTKKTCVYAKNEGAVMVNGPLFMGRSFRKDSFIHVQGITFEGGGSLYNTSFNSIKNCGFHGAFGVGTNDHANGNSNNLIEDVWIWASQQRIIAINYQANQNVWRRVIVRGDGCNTSECTASGSPSVGISVYDSRDNSMQNVMVIDRVLTGVPASNYYSDFATAQHSNPVDLYLGRNEWLGPMSINAPDSGFTFEADNVIANAITWTLTNALVVSKGGDGINMGSTGPVAIRNATAISSGLSGDGIRIAPGSPSASSVTNVVVKGFNRGINSSITPSYTDTFGGNMLYNQTTPTVGVHSTNPLADGGTPSIKYPVRIEAGSLLKGAGQGGADIGANLVNRYGAEGTYYGTSNYNSLSNQALWPWPNEARIKKEMCVGTTRGFCSTGKRLDGINPITLTSYIWESLGNPIPAGIYP